MLLSFAGPGAQKAALDHEKGWGSNGKKYSIRFSKVIILKGKERMEGGGRIQLYTASSETSTRTSLSI